EKETGAANAGDDKPKRRRKRKKITAENYRGGNGDRGKGRKKDNEVKQVTAKEIEEKIKATMARISGGKSNKRQRTRRDSRDAKREKQEMLESMVSDEKLQVTEFISVSEFASLLDVAPTDIIMACMNLGVIVSINQRLDAEIIELVAEEFEREIEFISAEDADEEEEEEVDDPADLEPRAPIVTVMGHVDHGKTSLLDYIRNANVAGGEAGGITQHIGAYEVNHEGKMITFLDTPGHEAFTAMRARGAKVTDVVIIIIAADDRIMPQTKEAISHAQAAGVPMVFAINKIDKPGANPNKIKEELSGMNILVEEWGGKFQSQDISAIKGIGINELLEKVALEAEVLDLKANPNRLANGTVMEASLDKGRGYVTKILVQAGTLSIGDVVVAGGHSGKVKAMFDERGKRVKSAGPSKPVLLLGLSGAPQAGERFKEYESEQEARALATKRQQIEREQTNRASKRISLDEIGRRLALGSFKELNLIIKGDVDGSVEALADSLIKLSVESVQVNVIHKAVGPIAESDVLLASASDAIILGFQVRPSSGARGLAEREGVEIKTYSIIYEAIDEIKAAMEGMLDTIKEEKVTCEVEIRETFKISKVGTIAGCYVSSGTITRNTLIRVIRDGIVVYPLKEGQVAELGTLKRFKDDVKEVSKGFECGLTVKNFNDVKIGDIIEGYEIVEKKQKLEDAV
ncbi:MAG: translation initiation factor IF-2, partial [Bacteroidota bacterium]